MKIRQLTAEGRRLYARLYAAVLDSGERRVVLSSEGDTAPTTDLLVWAGNNLPVLLDALDEAEEARARAAEAKRPTLGYAAVDLRACDRRPQPVLLGPWDDEKSVREAWGDTEGVVLTELSVLPTEEGQADA
ncbi:hypothetical protein [Nocardia farcinica]|uniref:Uncharacterized protein n=1 Tax=Nocardia farcinica (strain IFM 10152) TaxID=247156 RepID=Q5YZP7_NOCFA|nr:hypothetical protein [Nocardia farcinica]BAD56344.1 hypothetical protein NFA_14990 [Nocardia farcinica IFM 10152]